VTASHARLAELVGAQVEALPPPADLRERRSRLRLLTLLHRLARPFERMAGPYHVTVSAIVVGPRGTVLHRHKRFGIWLQPGGHVEPGESPWQAARREGAEETGLALRHAQSGPRPFHVDVHRAGDHLHHDLRYLLLASDVDPRPGPGESSYARWFSWVEAIEVADPGLTGALRAARSMVPGR
jgi:8-oxo-dGTP pyrophosphatase MutT (NUDIX family)